MYSRYMCLLLLGIVAVGCNQTDQKSNALQKRVDSLQLELQSGQKWIDALQEVGVLMDSIDSRRNLLRVNMVEGTAYNDYIVRMKSIQGYIANSQRKIDNLEQTLNVSKGVSKTFSSIANRLRSDLSAKSAEMAKLQRKAEKYQEENSSLIKEVLLQEAEMKDKDNVIDKKKKELTQAKEEVQDLIVKNRVIDGNAYYARGEAIEETAKRTRLAPRKKKQTYEQALLMYRKALSLGVAKAGNKIEELQKKVD